MAFILSYLEERAGATDTVARDNVLEGWRDHEEFNTSDLERIYDYASVLGTPAISFTEFTQGLRDRDFLSRRLVEYIMDLFDGIPFAFGGPQAADLIHWYDFTDGATLFTDLAGTIPALAGQQVRNVRDKGTDPEDLLGVAGDGNPTLLAGVVGGLSALDFATEDGGDLSVIITTGITAATGLTMASVWRRPVAFDVPTIFPARVIQWEANGVSGEVRMSYDSSGNGRPQFESNEVNITGPNPNLVDNQWEWFYHTNGQTFGEVRSSHSGPSVEINTTSFNFNNPPDNGAILRVGQAICQIAEIVIFDDDFDVAPLASLTGYFDGRFGTLPF